MNKIVQEQAHIINGVIKKINIKHPFESITNKSVFAKILSDDLGLELFCEVKNIYYTKICDRNISLFIEHTDGGGKVYSKKVSITSTTTFRNKIKNFEPCLIINMYAPLDENLQPIENDIIYLIIKPSEISKSKAIQTENPSSRWVKIDSILEVVKTKITKMNKKNNVYLVHNSKIKDFLSQHLFLESYDEMMKNDIELNKKENKPSTQKIFRAKIAMSRGMVCQWLNCSINIPEMLIASHIRAQRFIKEDTNLTDAEKINQLVSSDNGLLLCKWHDAAFDKHLISLDDNGKLLLFDEDGYTNISTIKNSYYPTQNNERVINITEGMKFYLDFHRKETQKKRRIKGFIKK